MFIVASYDIADEKRLNKIARVMKDYGDRVLYSVFECLIDEDTFRVMKKRVSEIMDPLRDSVIYFRLCNKCSKQIKHIGRERFFIDEGFVEIV